MNKSLILRIHTILSVLLLALLSYACTTTSASHLKEGSRVTVIGKAVNTKSGAAVILKEGAPLYISKLHAWPKKTYGTRVRVSGVLKKEGNPCPKRKPGEVVLAMRCGTFYSLLNWKLH